MAQSKQVGDQIGPYLLLSVLGEGGAGQVFRARWRPDDQQRADAPDNHPDEVAIKLLRSAHAGSEAIFHRFVREIGLAQRIHHPHIVQHLDSGLADDFLYYAMELVPYGSLRDVLRKRATIPWRDAVESAAHIADALACLHDAGVIHRDLKPDNVFLSESGGLKLGDFGLAMTEDGPQLTMAGQTVGSVRYMAPEQVKGQRDLDGRCDLYALGCLLFEMRTGRPPFEATDPMVVFYKHVEEAPAKLRMIAPDTPEALEELVDRLLEKDKRNRPPSAHGVRAALEAIHASETGEVDNLDDLLTGEVAEIEAAPEDPEDQAESLAGLTTSPITSGFDADSSLFADATDDAAEADRDPSPERDTSSPEVVSDLSKRLAEGGASAAKINPVAVIGVALALAIAAAVGVLSIAGEKGSGPPASEDSSGP